MKEILRTDDPSTIAFARVLLEAEGIDAFELDVHMNAMRIAPGVVLRRLAVADRDAFVARAILADNGLEPSR